jgi:hypothetical protein
MSIEFNAAVAELEAVHEEHALLSGIRSFTSGQVKEGYRPDILAKAIKLGVALPLKYTHSFRSLRNLYVWAVESQDTEIIRWTTHHIIQVLGRTAMDGIAENLKATKKIPSLEKSPRQIFHEVYKKLNEEDVRVLRQRLDPDSFWYKQLGRFVHANQAGARLLGRDLHAMEHTSLGQTLSTAMKLEYQRIPLGDLSPRAIVEKAKISPYVIVPSLFDAFGGVRNWKTILESELLYKGMFRKEVVVEPEVVEMLLKLGSAADDVIEEFVKKWK